MILDYADPGDRAGRWSEAAWFLRLRVRIPVTAWMLVVSVGCVGSGLRDEMITRSKKSYRACV
jgi:hypothetical protein